MQVDASRFIVFEAKKPNPNPIAYWCGEGPSHPLLDS